MQLILNVQDGMYMYYAVFDVQNFFIPDVISKVVVGEFQNYTYLTKN